jgi:hypothetical protein
MMTVIETGECSLGLFDALLWWPHSPLALNLDKL